MDAARRGKWIGFLCLGVTAFGWALNWPLMKLLLQQWPPLFARGVAGVAAALILIGIAKARGHPLEVPREAVRSSSQTMARSRRKGLPASST